MIGGLERFRVVNALITTTYEVALGVILIWTFYRLVTVAAAFFDNVVLAHDLSPSQTAGLDPELVLGFATEAGGRASHTAIVAEALEIPAVVGVGRFLEQARQARTVIVDGDEGLVVLDPGVAGDPP